ncbi:hypothetical protein MJO28_014283 [Puccinia striiformis f. sp. tritici]|uniref:Uncharacterized protein n=1 Tax=Puccinia striiformis f. sp. tritici TaxID=168172 RepID=A0ACC0DT35_9BASI|nr:hypothetical protein MJO28_014283 [Puccinia striiformis f. sp. tritici]
MTAVDHGAASAGGTRQIPDFAHLTTSQLSLSVKLIASRAGLLQDVSHECGRQASDARRLSRPVLFKPYTSLPAGLHASRYRPPDGNQPERNI